MAVLVALLAALLVEIVVAVWVAQLIGFWWMAFALVGLSVLGFVLLPRVGLQALRRVQDSVARGEKPGRELVDGGMKLVAATLLLIPGFVTGAIGLLLLVPFVRHGVARWWGRRINAKVEVIRASYGGAVIDTSATEGTSPTDSSESSAPRPELPAP